MLGTHVSEGEPEEVSGIVEGMEGGISGDVNAEEEVAGVDDVAAVGIGVGDGEEEFAHGGLGAGFLAHFAHDACLGGLTGIHEAAGEVEGAACGFVGAASDEKFLCITAHRGGAQNDGNGGGGGVGIVGEAAVSATLGAGIVLREMRGATARAVVEGGEGMHFL